MINNTGWYKGVIVDGKLGQSTNGFPQEVLALKAAAIYDEENAEFLPVDAEHDEITAYLILIDGKDHETKSMQQLKKITDWDGANFVDLLEMDLADLPLSFRVEENTYKENTTLQVSWVAEADASPGRTITGITKEEAQALQARYASVLAKTKAPVKAVSAKGKKAAPKATKPKAGRPKAPKAPAEAVVGTCTADDAYQECFRLKRDDVTEEDLNKLWLAAEAAVNEDPAKITEEEYFVIKTDILKVVSKV